MSCRREDKCDCVWFEWTQWSNCNNSCDGGVQKRSRSYLPAEPGGNSCDGDSEQLRDCNMDPCTRQLLFPSLVNSIYVYPVIDTLFTGTSN